MNDENKITWRAEIDTEEIVETSEPLASGWLKFKAFIRKAAPESQL